MATDSYKDAVIEDIRGVVRAGKDCGIPPKSLVKLAYTHETLAKFIEAMDGLPGPNDELEALWHYSHCPLDNCQRCINDESIIQRIRDRRTDATNEKQESK